MKIFFDTEFTGLHKDTTLISIGLISEDGKSFYAELNDYDKDQCDDWIKKNVIDNLELTDLLGKNFVNAYGWQESVGNKNEIRYELKKWLSQFSEVQFVSDVSHYDFVLLIDLLGSTAFDLPKNVCPSCHDINQDIRNYYGGNMTELEAFNMSREDILNDTRINLPSGSKHNSLYDAKVIRELYQILNNVKF